MERIEVELSFLPTPHKKKMYSALFPRSIHNDSKIRDKFHYILVLFLDLQICRFLVVSSNVILKYSFLVYEYYLFDHLLIFVIVLQQDELPENRSF